MLIIENVEDMISKLDKLIKSHPNNCQVDMMSTKKPKCGTVGCFMGDLWLIYKPFEEYSYSAMSDWFCKFISGKDSEEFLKWLDENTEIWGYENIAYTSCGGAYGKTSDNISTQEIRDHWAGVLDRYKIGELIMERILIRRASKGNLSGRIYPIGEALLPVEEVQLGTRIKRDQGNGTATDYIVKDPKIVKVANVGGINYVLGPVLFPDKHPFAKFEITIHHDNEAEFQPSIPTSKIDLI